MADNLKNVIHKFKDELHTMVKIKDVGDLYWLLGIEVECDHRLCTVFFSQCAYILHPEDPQLIQLTECESIEHPT